MVWNRKSGGIIPFCCFFLLFIGVVSCTISYKFNGASIDYNVVKSISIKDFPNMASYTYAPLASEFTEALKDKFIRQTRLEIVRENGTLDLEGEITDYKSTSMAPKNDGFDSDNRITISIRVRFTNEVNPDEDFEQTFSAYRDFSSDKMLQEVEGQLSAEIVEEIVDQIYNATVANW
ncbi:MAG: LPS assembly lipoprotein LptE [Tannerella sp.]|jgi:hypothetical protein|nr:LPS assembly lipoprotein LptE [Tannerella sp.]